MACEYSKRNGLQSKQGYITSFYLNCHQFGSVHMTPTCCDCPVKQLPASLSPGPFACVSAALSADEPVLCLQIPCAHHLSWHHGPRRSQTETHGRQNPRILFLICKELLIKNSQEKICQCAVVLFHPWCFIILMVYTLQGHTQKKLLEDFFPPQAISCWYIYVFYKCQ